MGGCPGKKGTQEHPGMVAKQAGFSPSTLPLPIEMKWPKAASADVADDCPYGEGLHSLDSVLPGTARTRENHQEQIQSLKSMKEVTQWHFTGTLCQPLKKIPSGGNKPFKMVWLYR